MRVFVSIAVVLLTLLSPMPRPTVTAQESVLGDLLPTADEIGPAFLVIDNRTRSLDEQATGFSNVDEAAGLLAGWNWQENGFQHFETDELTEAGAPAEKVDISLTRFESAEDAAAAMPYFLEDRAAILGQREFTSASPLGDESRGINGFYNGYYDVTIYTRAGPLLLRVSAASAAGSPDASPEQIAREIIARGVDFWQSTSTSTEDPRSIAGYLPDTLALDATTCAWSDADAPLDVPTFSERFDGVADAETTLGAMGWQEGIYRQFGCDAPASGHVGWLTMGVSRFADAQAAADAVAFFADARSAVTDLQTVPATALGESAAALAGPTVNGTEYTLYVSDGPLLFRVTGVAPDGDPRQDVETIAATLLTNDPGSPEAGIPTPTPQVLAVPTAMPAPRATMIPTPLPAPTEAPAPTIAPLLPTSTPVPTAAPRPQPTAVPSTIPVTVPTAAAPPPTATAVPTEPAPLPTAPAGSPPTPTPRVIHPPSQVGE